MVLDPGVPILCGEAQSAVQKLHRVKTVKKNVQELDASIMLHNLERADEVRALKVVAVRHERGQTPRDGV